MLDYLNETTYTKDLEQQQEMADLMQRMAETAPGEGLDDGFDDGIFETLGAEITQSNPEDEEDQAVEEQLSSLDDDDGSDMAVLSAIFQNSDYQPFQSRPLNNYSDIQNVVGDVDLNWLKKKTNGVKLDRLNGNISKYLNTWPQQLREQAVATSGNDDQHVEGSEHYQNNAVDLRYNDDIYNYIQNDPKAKQYGISLLNPDHGTAKHIHLQTKQAGGELYADTPETLRRGLNNPSYNSATLDLKGTNTIRGLDNYQPVAVTDGSKYQVLTGPQDTTKMTGKVYEQRMQTGGQTIPLLPLNLRNRADETGRRTPQDTRTREEAEAQRRAIEAQRMAQQQSQSTIGPSRQANPDRTWGRNLQAAKEQGMNFNPNSGRVSPLLSDRTDQTLRNAQSNIVEPMLEMEGVIGGIGAIEGLSAAIAKRMLYSKGVSAAESISKFAFDPDRFVAKQTKPYKDVPQILEKYNQTLKYNQEINNQIAGYDEWINNPEARRRIRSIFDISNKDIDNFEKPNFLTQIDGAHYNNKNNELVTPSLPLDDADGYTSPQTVYHHELSHWLQGQASTARSKRAGVDRGDWLNRMYNRTDKVSDQMANEWMPKRSNNKIEQLQIDYASTGVEPLAHIREMKQQLIENGVINNHLDEVTDEMVQTFLNTNPNLRMARLSSNTPKNVEALRKLLNMAPAAAPVIGAAAVAGQQKQTGGVAPLKRKSEGLGVEDWWNNREDVQATYKPANEVDPFVSEWFKHPETKRRMVEMFDEKSAKEYGDKLQEYLNILPVYQGKSLEGIKTSDMMSNHRLQGFKNEEPSSDYYLNDRLNSMRPEYNRLGIYNSSIHSASVDDWNDKPTVAHELMHASGIQDPLDFRADLRFNKIPKDPSKESGKLTYEYLERDGIYPRLMEMRRAMNVKPGQNITQDMIEDLNVNGYEQLRMMYDDKTILEMLNTLASNKNNRQSNAV